MTNEKINEYITKNVLKRCWHVPDPDNVDECLVCKCAFQDPVTYEPFDCRKENPDFFGPDKWKWLGILWEGLKGTVLWDNFWDYIYGISFDEYMEKTNKRMPTSYFWNIYLVGTIKPEKCIIDPPVIATKLVKCMEKRKNGYK